MVIIVVVVPVVVVVVVVVVVAVVVVVVVAVVVVMVVLVVVEVVVVRVVVVVYTACKGSTQRLTTKTHYEDPSQALNINSQQKHSTQHKIQKSNANTDYKL